ncbi:MAG TPA: ethanolamine ammonia-lyase reactivating factor EutA, partial [Planctomycetaceae bacterium]
MTLLLAGLDVGTTTTSLMVAQASLVRNCITGRNELGSVVPIFRGEPVFTRYRGGKLDIESVERRLDRWFAAAGLEFSAITGGGALITGLAAQSSNAPELTQLIKNRFQNAVVARADDPCLESWLAFMGNSLELSRAEPARAVVNLDIGGGTTNIAWGLAGEVLRCGCYYVGARHIEVEPGTYRLKSLSAYGDELLFDFGFASKPGRDLTPSVVERVLDFYVGLLESAVIGRPFTANSKMAELHCQAEFAPPQPPASAAGDGQPIITLSGGVGELAYR